MPGVSLGVPEIDIVPELNVSPLGNPVTLYTIVPLPPVAVGTLMFGDIAIPLFTLYESSTKDHVIGTLAHTANSVRPSLAVYVALSAYGAPKPSDWVFHPVKFQPVRIKFVPLSKVIGLRVP